jgi:Family of unknown function (DUF5372)
VLVTHPQHPLFGQQLQVVRTQQSINAELDLIVCLPDGTHAALAVSCTDYQVGHPIVPVPADTPLLDLEGLRRLAQLIANRKTVHPLESIVQDQGECARATPHAAILADDRLPEG